MLSSCEMTSKLRRTMLVTRQGTHFALPTKVPSMAPMTATDTTKPESEIHCICHMIHCSGHLCQIQPLHPACPSCRTQRIDENSRSRTRKVRKSVMSQDMSRVSYTQMELRPRNFPRSKRLRPNFLDLKSRNCR